MGKQANGADKTAPIMNYIKIARPDHWIKNVFIMPGLVLAIILMGKPEDMAAAVAYLASDDAQFVTGHMLDVNGGMYMA